MADIRFRQQARRVHELGERVMVELIAELVVRAADPVAARATVQRYAGLDPDMLRAVGGDRMPAMPFHAA